MNFTIKSGIPEKQRSACVVIGIFESHRLSTAAAAIDAASKKYLSNILKRGDMGGKLGQSLLLHNVPGTSSGRILLVGCGKEKQLDGSHYRRLVANAINKLKLTGATEAVSYLSELNVKNRDDYWKLRQFVEISQSALYEFRQLKSKNKQSKNKLKKLVLVVSDRKDVATGNRAIKDGTAIGNGVALARDLANLPPNICTPSYLADQAKKLGKSQKSVKVTVLDEAAMDKLGMGSLLSVSQGSRQPAKLISMEYTGGKKDEKPFVLIGKGVTFDT